MNNTTGIAGKCDGEHFHSKWQVRTETDPWGAHGPGERGQKLGHGVSW